MGNGKTTTIKRRKTTIEQMHGVEARNGRASIVAFVQVDKMLGKSEAIALIDEVL